VVKSANTAGIGVLGVPANSAGLRTGVASAPSALREAGLVRALAETAVVRDFGDVRMGDPSPTRDPGTGLIDPSGLVALVASVRTAVASILHEGLRPLVLGGDCPLLLGCLAAARRGRLGLLFVDGHEDAYLPAQSPTGEAADTELAFALGLADASWSPDLASILPLVTTSDVRILGARDRATIDAEGAVSIADRVPVVDDVSLAADPVALTRAATTELHGAWWFHLDLDVLSTQALPSVDYPQPGGLSWDDLDRVAVAALSSAPVGWDVTIYNPDLDPNRTDAKRIVEFIGSAVARIGDGPGRITP
jgi:arginase